MWIDVFDPVLVWHESEKSFVEALLHHIEAMLNIHRHKELEIGHSSMWYE